MFLHNLGCEVKTTTITLGTVLEKVECFFKSFDTMHIIHGLKALTNRIFSPNAIDFKSKTFFFIANCECSSDFMTQYYGWVDSLLVWNF